MLRCNRQKLIDALLKPGRILLPQQVVQEHPHGIHTHAFGPAQFLVDLSGIERGVLPHLQLVNRVLWNVVASNQPWLLCVPVVGFLLGPPGRLRLRANTQGSEENAQHRTESTSHRFQNSAPLGFIGSPLASINRRATDCLHLAANQKWLTLVARLLRNAGD